MAWRINNVQWLEKRWASRSITERGAIEAGMTVTSLSAVDQMMGVILASVGVTTKGIATAIKNKSQFHVPYWTGTLSKSAGIVANTLEESANMSSDPSAAYVGARGIEESYMPDNVTPQMILMHAWRIRNQSKFGSLLDPDMVEATSQYSVIYTEDYALAVHEGFRYGVAIRDDQWSQTLRPPDLGPPTSHFLSNALEDMRQRMPMLYAGVIRTAFAEVRDSVLRLTTPQLNELRRVSVLPGVSSGPGRLVK